MPIQRKVRRLATQHIKRLAQLCRHLKTVQFSSLSFNGVHKFTCKPFPYKPRHVDIPKSLNLVGKDWRVLNSDLAVSFGGTVSPVADAFQMAALLAQATVKNRAGTTAIVVGGGVYGIDLAAHLGALDAHGVTVAVLANPVTLGLHPYVPRRHFLEDGILSYGGLILSEYDEPTNDRRDRLLQRDRVITALCDVFIAVECSKDSATVDSAKRARIQGRRVLAVDWRRVKKKWHNPNMSGARQLFSEVSAEPFPFRPVADVQDPLLLEQYEQLLSTSGRIA